MTTALGARDVERALALVGEDAEARGLADQHPLIAHDRAKGDRRRGRSPASWAGRPSPARTSAGRLGAHGRKDRDDRDAAGPRRGHRPHRRQPRAARPRRARPGDPVYGAGRINALRALQAAQAYVRPVAPQPVAAPRKRVRIFITCTVGARKVRFGARPPRGARGRQALLQGPHRAGAPQARLEVQRFAARGGWRRVGKVKTNNRGRFGFTLRLRTVGNWNRPLGVRGNAALLPAGSLGAKLVVAPRR